ncbi:GspE/PulE family protein [Rhodoluna limnophila]|uniref:GspE/PulE family protein n=1 Tax=Rhodoluna limnophila TaxID=232537 RepID=UPI0011058E18|nr:ATPase, T2SS/T4P/T4SS family [Rhodoluna limnophila]
MYRSLIDIFVTKKLISREQIEEFQGIADSDEELANLLLKKGLITSRDMAEAAAARSNTKFVSVKDYPVNATTIALIPAELCRRHTLLPLEQQGNILTLAVSDPTNVVAIDDVRAATKMIIEPVVASREEILTAINTFLRSDEELTSLSSEIQQGHAKQAIKIIDDDSEKNAPIVRFVNLLIAQAIQDRASDIHLEPGEHDLRIRFRIDGVLHESQRQPKSIQAEILSRIKVMSDMDISERRIPQDGRMTFTSGSETRDLRVASLPTVWGEKIVLRILDSRTTNMTFEELGLRPENLEAYRSAVEKPWGMTLVTGPTGSGKTTTLYASLGVVSGPEVNVITIEDPIEYRMLGINQMQVNQRAGLTFANALRSILRADPNIVMVGEIRDRETAQIAVESALTGHLVLSTLHTNDAPSAVTRLIELGVEPFLVASALDCVMAQRLARRLCGECKIEFEPKQSHLKAAGFLDSPKHKDATFFGPGGCNRCSKTGYRGRLAIHEVMPITEGIERLILDRASSSEIEALAISEGMSTLRDDGFAKVAEGLTSIEEVLRVVA